jgi:DNA-directed RNA polymerase specialized sigma24 family protein
VAWRFEHDDTARTTRVIVEDPSAVTEFSEKVPYPDRIASVLTELLTVHDIAAECDLKEDVVRTTLNRNRGRFVKVGDKWGLRSQIPDTVVM